MRADLKAVFGVTMLAGLLAIAAARAEDASKETPPVCEVPAYLLSSESSLPKVAAAVKDAQKLDILVVGSRSSTINAVDGTAYPGRLEATLREKLPAVKVNVNVELQIKKTAEEVAAGLTKLVAERKPSLVVWQTGTVDALRSIDPDDFRVGVDEGVAALRAAGTDVVLMNLQYSPRTETMITVNPYLDNMRLVAQQREVPLFD